jgi:thiol:disulfide interchange protein DsbC
MKNFFSSTLLSLLVLFTVASSNLQAAPADAKTAENIQKSLEMILPGIKPDSVLTTPVPGVYEVMFGPKIVYMTEDARFLIQGTIVDLQTRENLTEPRIMEAKINAIESVGTDNMVIYSVPEGTAVKHRINVFTDIDCGYCRKLHDQMAEYNEKGIEIRYLFFPRAGQGSASYKKAVQVWCAEDKRAAMDTAKAGGSLKGKDDCENPVDDHMLLGSLVGVSGTPALVLDDGKLVPGYVPPDRLIQVLDARKEAN